MSDHFGIETGLTIKVQQVRNPQNAAERPIETHPLWSSRYYEKPAASERICLLEKRLHSHQKRTLSMLGIPSQQQCKSKEPLMIHDIPPGPWLPVATDIFQLGSHHYVLVADMYSKMPFVPHLSSLTTSSAISFPKNIISVHDIPTRVIILSDNGPQYVNKNPKLLHVTGNSITSVRRIRDSKPLICSMQWIHRTDGLYCKERHEEKQILG